MPDPTAPDRAPERGVRLGVDVGSVRVGVGRAVATIAEAHHSLRDAELAARHGARVTRFEDFDLGTFLVDLVLEQAAAYYDPRGKVMVLAPWLGPAERREALAHELVHALQDVVLDLDRFLSPGPGRSDEALARQSLVEGEAVALTLDLALEKLELLQS